MTFMHWVKTSINKKAKRDYMYESIRKQAEIILVCKYMKGTSQQELDVVTKGTGNFLYIVLKSPQPCTIHDNNY